MKSKQRSKLNGSPDIPSKKKVEAVKEYYGAKIDKKVECPPVEEVRKATKKYPREPPKPERKYDLGNTVSVAVKGSKWTNWIICGHEWGGDHRDFRRDIWLYRIRPSYAIQGAEAVLVSEEVIQGIISQ